MTACIRYLTTLEQVFSGARRSRLIIEELLQSARMMQTQNKRTYSEIGGDEVDLGDEVDFSNYFLDREVFANFSYPYAGEPEN